MLNYRPAKKNEEPCKSCRHHIPQNGFINWAACSKMFKGLHVNLKYRCDDHEPYVRSRENV